MNGTGLGSNRKTNILKYINQMAKTAGNHTKVYWPHIWYIGLISLKQLSSSLLVNESHCSETWTVWYAIVCGRDTAANSLFCNKLDPKMLKWNCEIRSIDDIFTFIYRNRCGFWNTPGAMTWSIEILIDTIRYNQVSRRLKRGFYRHVTDHEHTWSRECRVWPLMIKI